MRRHAGKHDAKIFNYTARRVKKLNIMAVPRRGGNYL